MISLKVLVRDLKAVCVVFSVRFMISVKIW